MCVSYILQYCHINDFPSVRTRALVRVRLRVRVCVSSRFWVHITRDLQSHCPWFLPSQPHIVITINVCVYVYVYAKVILGGIRKY